MGFGKSKAFALLAMVGVVTFVLQVRPLVAQDVQGDLAKRIKTRVQPTYPELARRMNVKGTVKLMVTVAANGKVKSTKVVGGNPVLVSASEDAVRRWKFEAGSDESTGLVEFTFQSDGQ
jgi:TonB family protein